VLAEPVVGLDHLASGDGDRPARPQLDREEAPDGFGVEQRVAPGQRNVGCEYGVWQRAPSLPPARWSDDWRVRLTRQSQRAFAPDAS